MPFIWTWGDQAQGGNCRKVPVCATVVGPDKYQTSFLFCICRVLTDASSPLRGRRMRKLSTDIYWVYARGIGLIWGRCEMAGHGFRFVFRRFYRWRVAYFRLAWHLEDAVLYNHVTKKCRYVHAFAAHPWASEANYCHARTVKECLPMLQAFETQVWSVTLDINGRDRIWNIKRHSLFGKVCSTCTYNAFRVHI